MRIHQVVARVEEYGPHRSPRTSPLRTLRALSGLSAVELARLADVDRSTVRRAEMGVGKLQERTARKFAAVLGCPTDLLFPSDDDDDRPA